MTTNIAAEIKATHAIVWQWRNLLEPHWPTPHRQDAVRFAFTEVGEAMDAELRSVPQYARNNSRNMSVPDELADCAMMLCTAAGEPFDYGAYLPDTPNTTLDGICFQVGWQLLSDDVRLPLRMIATYLRDQYGESMSRLVDARLRRIAAKVTAQ